MNKKSTIIALFALTLLIGMASGYSLRGVLPPPAEPNKELSETRGYSTDDSDRVRQRTNGRERMRQYLIDQLELEADQIDAVMLVLSEHRREMAQITEASRESLQEQIRAQSDEMNQELSALLTEEQFQRWEAIHEQRERRHRQRREQ